MKNKGFTLIELLAVIVILAIIALITVPLLLNVIKNAKKGAFKDSAYGIVEAANLYYSTNMLKNNGEFVSITFNSSDGKMVSASGEELIFKGTKPIGKSNLTISSSGEISMKITDGTYWAVKDAGDNEIAIDDSADGLPDKAELLKRIEALEAKNTIIEQKNNDQDNTISNMTKPTSNDNLFLKTYPLGSIYTSVSNINPSTLFGGTWEEYGAGRTLVGVDSTKTEFATVEKNGGSITSNSTHNHTTANTTLTIAQIPSHNHNAGIQTDGTIIPQGMQAAPDTTGNTWRIGDPGTWGKGSVGYTGGGQAHNHGNTGNATVTTNTLQPYITVYMWKRIK